MIKNSSVGWKALIELFKVLDTKLEDIDPYDTSDLTKFTYVNGGLFADENIEIPHFTDEIKRILLSNASDEFDWSSISPTIFGEVFESTLNPETRPLELQKVHNANNKAVMEAYGFNVRNMTEEDCVAELMKLY